MLQQRLARWLGEFFVIVVGVLVALAVDDLAQRRADRELEEHLLDRLSEDLVADAADLALAQVQVARRTWLFDATARAIAEGGTIPPPPDSLVSMPREEALLRAAGRPEASQMGWDPLSHALWYLQSHPEFDLSDDSYQEMIATGAFRTLEDPLMRSTILSYYRTAEDLGANVTQWEEYMPPLTEELIGMGVAVADTITLDEFVGYLRRSESLAARGREARVQLRLQAASLRRIGEARVALERMLARREGR